MNKGTLDALVFCTIPEGKHQLGWRFDEMLPPEVSSALDGFLPRAEWLRRFSPGRTVEIPAFEIARDSIALEDVLGDPYELDDDIVSIEDVCDAVDAVIRPAGLRLPSEDQLEAACAGALFWWGMRIPDGVPYGTETTFALHRRPTERGLVLNSDPYNVEVVRDAFKLGDGGAAICGAYPWPVAWLALAPCWRLGDEDVEDSFVEHLESARVRPVR